MVVILIPLGIWTVAGLIALWPHDVSSHVDRDVGFSVPGVTFPSGRITKIEEISCAGLPGSSASSRAQVCANVDVQILEGDDKGQSVTVQLTDALYSSGTTIGQEVKLVRIPPSDGQPAAYQFSDFSRGTPLLVLVIVFVVAVVAVARWRGFAAVLGLVFAGFILVKFVFPALVIGANPLLVGLIGSSAIMFVVLYAAHGFSARTTTALLGTLFGLILSAGFGYLATRWTHLTGVSSEDDYVLSAAAPDLQLTSVVMCGIIIAGLGVLNDVTITQASAVWELADSNPHRGRLFARAMRIGRDHIASTVYTIAFATAGAVLPVLLLIAIYNRPLLEVIQTEQFAAEVVRTLVGSIGLVLAVPLTTAIGVAVVKASRPSHRGDRSRDRGGAESDVAPGAALQHRDSLADADDRGGLAAADHPDPDDLDVAALGSDVPAYDDPPEEDLGSDESDESEGSADAPAGGTPQSRFGRLRARARPWRRSRPTDDDFDFSDLREP